MSQEIREDLLDELAKLMETVDGVLHTVGESAVKTALAVLGECLKKADALGDKAFRLAGAAAPQVVRDFAGVVRASPGHITEPAHITDMVVERAIEAILEAAEHGSDAALARSVAGAVAESVGTRWPHLLETCAACGAAEEALAAVGRLSFDDPAEKTRRIGMVAYYGRHYPDAIQNLDEVCDTLDCSGLCALGESYLRVGPDDRALSVFRFAASKAESPEDQFSAHFGAGRSLAEMAKAGGTHLWRDSATELEAAMQAFSQVSSQDGWPFEDTQSRQECEREYECNKLLGYTLARADWESRQLTTAKELLDESEDVLWGQHAWENRDYAGFCEPVNLSELYTLDRLAGCTAALADILSETSQQLDRQLDKVSELTQHIVSKDRQMLTLQQQVAIIASGWQPYAERLLAEYPGLPADAAKDLAEAQFQWDVCKMSCLPETIGHLVGRAVEIVVQQGLLFRMLEYALTRPEGQQHLGFDIARNAKLGIGIHEGRKCGAERINLKGAEMLLRESASVRSFVQFSYSGEVRRWLLDSAADDLKKVGELRNRADHTGEVREWQAPEILDFALRDGLLKRLYEAGGFAERANSDSAQA